MSSIAFGTLAILALFVLESGSTVTNNNNNVGQPGQTITNNNNNNSGRPTNNNNNGIPSGPYTTARPSSFPDNKCPYGQISNYENGVLKEVICLPEGYPSITNHNNNN